MRCRNRELPHNNGSKTQQRPHVWTILQVCLIQRLQNTTENELQGNIWAPGMAQEV